MKFLNVAKRYGAKVAAGGSMLVAGAGSAFAAVPADVTTALTDAKGDATTVAGVVIGIIVAIAAFLYMRRAIK